MAAEKSTGIKNTIENALTIQAHVKKIVSDYSILLKKVAYYENKLKMTQSISESDEISKILDPLKKEKQKIESSIKNGSMVDSIISIITEGSPREVDPAQEKINVKQNVITLPYLGDYEITTGMLQETIDREFTIQSVREGFASKNRDYFAYLQQNGEIVAPVVL